MGNDLIEPLTTFISYSHVDEPYLKRLLTELKTLQRSGYISSIWYDRHMSGGQEFDRAIDSNLERADLILLLVSSDFNASGYIQHVEVPRALQRHALGTAIVIPIILRQCLWKLTPLRKLLALPLDGEAVTSRTWKTEDEAFHSIAKGLLKVIEDYHCYTHTGAATGAGVIDVKGRDDLVQSANVPQQKRAEQAFRIYIAYSPEDHAHFETLYKHLRPFEVQSLLTLRHEQSVTLARPGSSVAAQMEWAELVVLLLSPDFIASKHYGGTMITTALERLEHGTYILPVLVRACLWRTTPLAELPIVPSDSQPIVEVGDTNERWLLAVQQVISIVHELIKSG